MKKLDVLVYPDQRLNLKAAPITEFNGKLKELANNMLHTMYSAQGIGLAAIQVNVQQDIFVMDLSKTQSEPIIFINPTIITHEETQKGPEGCLSFPGVFINVTRPKYLKVSAYDLNGNQFTMDMEDLAARCVHHEMEHLAGDVFIKDLSRLRQSLIIRKIEKYLKKHPKEIID